MTGAGGGENEERVHRRKTVDRLTSIFTRWAKEPRMSSFAHALGYGHVQRILPEVERVVLVAGHVEPVAAITGSGTGCYVLYLCSTLVGY